MKTTKKVSLRFYADQDQDIIAWLDRAPKGQRTLLIKDALRAYIRGEITPPTMSAPTASLPFDLADIRRVVEAAIAESGALVASGNPAQPGPDNDHAECDALLDQLFDEVAH